MKKINKSKIIIDKSLKFINSRQFDLAEDILKKELEKDIDSPDLLNLLGYVKVLKNNFEEGIIVFKKLVSTHPKYIKGWFNLASALQILKKFEESSTTYDEILKIEPQNIKALVDQGIIFSILKKNKLALTNHEKAIEINKNYYDAWINKGIALKNLSRPEQAIKCYQKAIEIKPNFHVGWLNKGSANIKLKNYSDALSSYEKAFELNSKIPEIEFNIGLVKLTLGEFNEGFKKYERRWKIKGFEKYRHQNIKVWTGQESLKGKKILIWTEQGYGDTFQFSRYIFKIIERGGEVIFEVKSRVKNLIKCLSDKITVIEYGENFPNCDYQSPLMSLPLCFKTSIKNIPNKVPYFDIDSVLIKKWSNLINEKQKPGIGLAWSTSSKYKSALEKSIPIHSLLPILHSKFNFFSIQKDLTNEEKLFLKKNKIVHIGDQDFLNTAALMKNLDLIISIDTSLAHLSGSLNLPTWILLSYSSDWRWLIDKSNTPWYPSAKLFRQNRIGDWESVIKSIENDLKNLFYKV